MKSNLTLTKKDIVVVLFCAFFLFMNLGAVGARGNEHAKRILCASNLKKLNIILGFFLGDNEGKFADADWNDDNMTDYYGQWWIQPLKQYMKEGEKRFLFCGKAKRTQPEATLTNIIYLPQNEDEAWGSRDLPFAPTAGQWTWGSFAPNGWIMDPKDGIWASHLGPPWSDPSAYWEKVEGITNPSRVPVFLDCRWVDAWPHHTDVPDSEPYVFDGTGYMRIFTILRHGKAINSLFADGSVSRVPIKDLWKLKWHKGFDTANPYADEANLPDWMK